MTMRVLVTGSSGFTARYVVPLLLRRGHSVLGLESKARQDGAFPVLNHDLTDDTTRLRAELREFRPTHVLHLAALSHVTDSSPAAYYAVNTIGTENLLRTLQASGVELQRIVLAGTANVYGNTPRSPIREDETPAPQNHYGFSKLLMEQVAGNWFRNLPVTVARPFNYTGVGQAESFLVPKIVGYFARRAPLIPLGNLSVSRDISDVRFVAEIYCRLLEARTSHFVVNICSGRSIPLRSILEELQAISGHVCNVEKDPALVRTQEISDLKGDDYRLRSILPDLAQPPEFRETLKWMYEQALKNA
jgi:nucleoside-diphosphate-sugar epimerase